jgi:DNA-binding CsgD family transcriptional regulator
MTEMPTTVSPPQRSRSRGRRVNCDTVVSFPTKPEARSRHKTLAERISIFTSVVHCETCDQYHILVTDDSLGDREYEVLRMLARGFLRDEIAKEIGWTPWQVNNFQKALYQRLYVFTRPHLVAIAISLGMLDPADFIPALTERNHP